MAVTWNDLSDAVAPVASRYRERIRDLREWALARGRRLAVDDVALVLAVKERAVEWSGGDFDLWTRLGVYHHMRVHTFNWCTHHDVLVPEFVPEALWDYLHWLHDRQLFADGSDPFPELLKPLRCYGGLDADGVRDPSPEQRVGCECMVPFEASP